MRKEDKKKEIAESGQPKPKKKKGKKESASAVESDYGVSMVRKGSGSGVAEPTPAPTLYSTIAPSPVAYTREELGGYQVRSAERERERGASCGKRRRAGGRSHLYAWPLPSRVEACGLGQPGSPARGVPQAPRGKRVEE
jgi:hypothetical protein